VTADRTVFLPVATRPSVETCVDHARRAQALGYDRVWLAESWGRDLVTILTSVARETTELGISASILPVYFRSPALLGQTAVTLQEVADGRVRIGLGPSSAAVVEGWHGATYGNPLKRTRETIEIARRVCTGAPVDYDGTYFDLEGFELRCEPPDTPPTIDAAGIGPKAVELAGWFADGWHALMFTREGLASRMAALRGGAPPRRPTRGPRPRGPPRDGNCLLLCPERPQAGEGAPEGVVRVLHRRVRPVFQGEHRQAGLRGRCDHDRQPLAAR